MPTLNDLLTEVNVNPTTRDNLFNYHRNNGMWPGLGDYEARTDFEISMMNPAQRNLLANIYLPAYNAAIAARPAPARPSSGKFKRALPAILTVAGMSVVGYCISDTLQDGQMRNMVQNASAWALVADAFATLYMYLTD